ELRGARQPWAPPPPRREGTPEDARLQAHPRRRLAARHRPRGRRRQDHRPATGPGARRERGRTDRAGGRAGRRAGSGRGPDRL
ncbi:MAG: hypothetical protein AVDCRST_MAG48-2466, partial [uncultured Friedmanniella sp.]